jgi:hypothetical protein
LLTVKSSEKGEPSEKSGDEDFEFYIYREPSLMHYSHRCLEGDADSIKFFVRVLFVIPRNIEPLELISTEHTFFRPVNGFAIQPVYTIEQELSPTLADAHFSKLFEGIDEIGEIIVSSPNQDQVECQRPARLIDGHSVGGRLDYERMRCFFMLSDAKYIRLPVRKGFEDVGINATGLEEAVAAFRPSKGTYDTSEGCSEPTAKRRTLVRRKMNFTLGLESEPVYLIRNNHSTFFP